MTTSHAQLHGRLLNCAELYLINDNGLCHVSAYHEMHATLDMLQSGMVFFPVRSA